MNAGEYTAWVNAHVRMSVKHWHKFEVTSTCNGNRHGMYSRCECGARRFGGSVGNTLVTEYFPRARA